MPTRGKRSVQNPKPAIVRKIRDALAADPTISKKALAREAGISRAALYMYLAAMTAEVEHASRRSSEVHTRAALTQLALLDRLHMSTAEITQVISTLRRLPTTPATAGAIFRGYAVLEKHHRLIGELLGEVAPPTTNVYLTQVQALLAQPIDASHLPRAVADALRLENAARGPAS